MKSELAALSLFALLTVGCATPQTGPTMTSRGPPPTKEQAERAIKSYLASTLKDPDSVKQFELFSGPSEIQWYRGLIQGGGNEQGWMVCFRYNAKNSYGAYAGLKTDGLALRVSGNDAYVLPNVN